MKSWHIALIALFMIAFLALGRVLSVSPTEELENTKQEEEVLAQGEPEAPVPPAVTEQDLGSVSPSLLESIYSVKEESLPAVFKNIEKELNALRDPSNFLIQVLSIDSAKGLSENINMVKGYAINSFFHRIESRSDFLPNPMVEQSFVQLAQTEKHPELALELVTRLKDFFGYDRDKILQVIDHRSDRDSILENLFQ